MSRLEINGRVEGMLWIGIDGSKSRYVSYHFEGRPEDIEEGKAALDVIRAVLEKTDYK